MKCLECNREADPDMLSLIIRPIAFQVGAKSGTVMVPDPEPYPDGEEEKVVCMDCIFKNHTELAEVLGFSKEGYDFDMRMLQESYRGG